MKRMQYTVRGISPELDARLRERARAEGKSLNALVVEALEQVALPRRNLVDDLAWFIGSGTTQEDRKAQEEAQAWLDSLPNDLAG